MSELPHELVGIVERGSFCHVAVETHRGPHLTPMVFVLSGRRLWVTTSRRSVKAHAWRRDPRVTGLVRAGNTAVSFAGRAQTYDVLDVGTWSRGIRRTPSLAAASIKFTRKNARFFAGYAVDANHVPLAWTPPGRVFVEIEMERAAVLEQRGVAETLGVWEPSVVSRETFRASKSGRDALDRLPAEVRDALGRKGSAVLAVGGRAGTVVLPATWSAEGSSLYAALPDALLGLATTGDSKSRVALTIDRPSWWRAKGMIGAMVQGDAELFSIARLRSGRASAAARVVSTGAGADGAALVRIRPERVVWWRGWSSGTVAPDGRG